MLTGTRQKLSSVSVNTLQLDDTTAPLSDFVKSLGVLLDSTLSMENFISRTVKSCLPAPSNWFCSEVSFDRGYSETGHPTHCVTPRLLQLSLSFGLPDPSVQRQSLRHIQNCAARLILKNIKLTTSYLCFSFSTGS